MKKFSSNFYRFGIFVIAVVVGGLLLQFYSSSTLITENAQRITKMSSQQLADQLELWLAKSSKVIEDASLHVASSGVADPGNLSYLQALLKANPDFASLYFGSADNVMINASGWVPPVGWDLRTRPWYQAAVQQNSLVITDAFVNASKDRLIMTIAVPVHDGQGKLLGVMGGDVDLNTIIQLVAMQKIGKDGYSFLLDGEGNLLAHPTLQYDGEVELEPLQDRYQNLNELLGDDQSLVIPYNDGLFEGFLAQTAVIGTNWTLVSLVPREEFTSEQARLLRGLLLSLILSILIIGVFLLLFNQMVIAPLNDLSKDILQIDVEKAPQYRLPKQRRQEFHELAVVINQIMDKINGYLDSLAASEEEISSSNQQLEAMVQELTATEEELRTQNENLSLQEKKLRESEARYRSLVSNLPGVVFRSIFHEKWTMLYISDIAAEYFGYPPEDFINDKEICFSEIIHPEDIGSDTVFIKKSLASGRPYETTYRIIRSNGEVRWMWESGQVDPTYQGEGYLVDGVILDVTERKEQEDRLHHMTMHDQLTGVYNRTYFEDSLLRLGNRHQRPVTLVSVDLDGLKLINDTLGHDQGDNLLRFCSQVLSRALRSSDILARVGGDEFAIILPQTALPDGEKVVARIEEELLEYNRHEPRLPLSISIGVAAAFDDEELELAYTRADDQMYRHKLYKGTGARSQILDVLMAALEERDYLTHGHANRLTDLCLKMGQQLNLTSGQLGNLALLSKVHDLGKVGIPDHILFKPGPLTPQEWEIMRLHPEKGYRIAVASPDLMGIAELILKHHERWDGTGYPLGLVGEAIPIECRILAIVDSFDAMTNDRPYSKGRSDALALEEIRRCAGTQFDPLLAEQFLKFFEA